jgi:TetR/AcrR family transcriptional regulator, regulator of cefoperazone and chloramphenicol sensitivity
MKANEYHNQNTRERLLEAAGEVFARCGFRAATIREICRWAGANVAAVNYHFGDKSKLYAEVLKHCMIFALKKYPPNLGLPENASAEDRLRAFIRSFLLRLLDKGRPAWHGQILAREIADPTDVLDSLVEETIRPQINHLAEIIRGLVGPSLSEINVRFCGTSIVGQCMYYRHARPVVTRLYPELKYSREDIDRLADHVARFSLAALKQLAINERSQSI